jgi:hypothetical protein
MTRAAGVREAQTLPVELENAGLNRLLDAFSLRGACLQ